MGYFKHHPDGIINVNGASFPLAWWVATQEPLYSLPVGMIGREYTQPSYHIVYDSNTSYEGTLPYTDGDGYITNKAAYEAAYDAYINPAPSLSEAKAARKLLVAAKMEETKAGGVISATFTFPSVKRFERTYNEYDRFTRAGAVAVGYYVLDINDAQRALNLAQLTALVDKIQELFFETDLIADGHNAAIDALGSVVAVEAYDYTTGWPTVPFV